VLTSAEKRGLVGRLTAGADEQSNAWGSIAGLLPMGSHSVDRASETISLAFIHRPVSFALIAQLQQTVLGVMSFAALGTFQIAAPGGSLMIIVLGNGKSGSATAGDEIHLEGGTFQRSSLGFQNGHSSLLI
jgi:hypothetical protein